MIEIFDDVEKAIKAGAYRSALTLALTIPDICGQIAYPRIFDVGRRYRKWFNKFVAKYYERDKLIRSLGIPVFDAFACYRLRCAILHSGNAKVGIDYINNFDFSFEIDADYTYSNDKYQACIEFDDDSDEIETISLKIRLDIGYFCTVMCMAGEDFYNNSENKDIFTKYSISIHGSIDEIESFDD